MDWHKDPVFISFNRRIVWCQLVAGLTFGMVVMFLFLFARQDDTGRRDVLRRIQALEAKPVISTAALADAEWREVNRRIEALEKSPVTSGASVSLLYDPDYFAIDARNRLTMKVSPARTTSDQCIVPSIRVFQPDITIDTRRPGETK